MKKTIIYFSLIAFLCCKNKKDNNEILTSIELKERFETNPLYKTEPIAFLLNNSDLNDSIPFNLVIDTKDSISDFGMSFYKFDLFNTQTDYYIGYKNDTIFTLRQKNNLPFSPQPFLIFKDNSNYAFGFTLAEYYVSSEFNNNDIFSFKFRKIEEYNDVLTSQSNENFDILQIKASKRNGIIGIEVLDKRNKTKYKK
ncbi:hypothetical protein [Seonamhaeicola sediminis]|uniref:hypothetical protein n=1 Tax=Seonamhaeicola sediminis TaxID=2528206 RepID=UPI0016478AF1|nr:hypothetical protein [Seonamhaeicola sediminis]